MILLPASYGVVASSGAAVTPVTWNPADKASLISLSGGNLIAGRTGSDTYQSVRATQGRSSGKYYFELLVGAATSSSLMVGIAKSTANLNSYVGSDADGYGYNETNGQDYHSGINAGSGATWASGDVIGVAYDASAGSLWFAKNNTWQFGGNPNTGTSPVFSGLSGTFYPMCSIFHGTAGETIVGRFRNADFSYSPPTGFSSWQ